VRYRLYSAVGLNAADVATVAAFCMITSGIGLSALAAMSFIFEPHQAAHLLHINHHIVLSGGILLTVGIGLYALWSLAGPRQIELFNYQLRAPAPIIALPQIVLAIVDLAVSAIVLWLLLPAGHDVSLIGFLGAYSIAITAGIISHVPYLNR
jgi:phosphatidylglycerol lysyltransferase